MAVALLVILLVLVLGAVPAWPYSRTRGYYPLLILLALFLTGRL